VQQLNQLEARHTSSLADLRSSEHANLLDERLGDIGPRFGDIEPLTMFHEEWSELRLDPEMHSDSLRFEVAAHWESTPPLPRFSGEYRIPAPMEIVSQGTDPSASMLNDDFHREFVSELRYFDNSYASGRGFMSYLRMVPNSSPLQVWFSALVGTNFPPYPPGYVRLDLTYNEYLSALLLTKGLYGWQYLYADVSFGDPALEHLTECLRNGLDALPDMFPGWDYTSLSQRLEARL